MGLLDTKEPFKLFAEWYDLALSTDMPEPTAMTLSTATKEGRPSSRVVLLKHFDENGFVFYTNLNSVKGCQLQENPYAALCFYWMSLDKQIRIEGPVEQVTDQEADEYFASRPRQSQIGAWASKQSTETEDRFALEKKVLNQ